MWLSHNIDVRYHESIGEGLDVDIYIPTLKVAIEYDGEYYHRGKEAEEKYKRKLAICNRHGVYLVHIMEQANYDIGRPLEVNEIIHDCFHAAWNKDIHNLVADISDLVYKVKGYKIPLSKPEGIINASVKNRSINKIKYEKSLAYLKPEIAKEWHPTLNGELTPAVVTCASHERAYFRCCKCGYGSNGEWNTEIKQRGSVGQGCPACYKRAVQMRKMQRMAQG